MKPCLALLSLCLLAACGLPGRTATVTPGGVTPTSAKATAAPTAVQPLAILVLPADLPKAQSDRYQTMFYNLAQASSLRFQVRNTLTADDLSAEGAALKVVVLVPPDPGAAALAAAAPAVQFLAIDIPGLTAGNNLSTIGSGGGPVDQEAFLAGYMAGLLAPEWKVGILSEKDTTGGEAARTAFANGFTYFCGACRNPNFSQPVGIYPVVIRIPTDAKPGEYSAYAKFLLDNFVKVAYIYPSLATPDLVRYLAQNGVLMIGESLPTQNVSDHWVASLQPDVDTAIQTAFPELVAGKGGQAFQTPIHLADVNADLLSAGKQAVVQQVLDDLVSGTIGTGVNP